MRASVAATYQKTWQVEASMLSESVRLLGVISPTLSEIFYIEADGVSLANTLDQLLSC